MFEKMVLMLNITGIQCMSTCDTGPKSQNPQSSKEIEDSLLSRSLFHSVEYTDLLPGEA